MEDTNKFMSADESEIAARLQRSLRPLLDVAAGEIDPTVLSSAGLRRAAIELYRLSDELIPSEMSEGDLLSYYRDVLLPLEGVSVYLEPGAIFVRTPMLAGRQSKQEIQSPRDKDIMFADSIHYAILAAERYMEYDFTGFKDKLISFLFVYSEQAYDRGQIFDTDNHEIKFVIDRLSGFLPGGDSPLCTSILMSTTITDAVEPGTYITVTPAVCGPLPTGEVIGFWKEKTHTCAKTIA